MFYEERFGLVHKGGVETEIALNKQSLGVLHVHHLFKYQQTSSQLFEQPLFDDSQQSSMIEREAEQLARRLSQLKSTSAKGQAQRIKQLSLAMTDYKPRITQQMHFLDSKIAQAEQQLQNIEKYEQTEGQEAVGTVNSLQTSLKNLLGSYTIEAQKAHKRLDYAVAQVRNEIRQSCQAEIDQEQRLLSNFHRISQQLQALIGEVRNRQKESQQQFVHLNNIIDKAGEELAIRRRKNAMQVAQEYDAILIRLKSLEESMGRKLDLIVARRQAQAQHIEKVVQSLLKQTTEWQQI